MSTMVLAICVVFLKKCVFQSSMFLWRFLVVLFFFFSFCFCFLNSFARILGTSNVSHIIYKYLSFCCGFFDVLLETLETWCFPYI